MIDHERSIACCGLDCERCEKLGAIAAHNADALRRLKTGAGSSAEKEIQPFGLIIKTFLGECCLKKRITPETVG